MRNDLEALGIGLALLACMAALAYAAWPFMLHLHQHAQTIQQILQPLLGQ